MGEANVTPPELDEFSIYEGGTLNEIKVEDLVNNPIAVKQLINNYNLKVKEAKNKESEIAKLRSDLEFQKTSPFVSIFAGIVNIVGAAVSSIAVNLLTDENPPKYANWILAAGLFLVIIGSLMPVLYPYAKDFFNKKGG